MTLFSIVTTVHHPEPDHLAACLASVDAQTEPSWQHIVTADASTRPSVRAVLQRAAEPRRYVTYRSHNGGIAVASNDALATATGEYVVLLDDGDVLEPDALERLRAEIDASGDDPPAVLYSDHDVIGPDGRYVTPMYKPVFSPLRLTNQNYITHLVAIRRRALEQVGGWRKGFNGAHDHDLLLRLADEFGSFTRVPGVLLHWRQAPASAAPDPDNTPAAYENGARAVRDHLARHDVEGSVEPGALPGVYRVRRAVQGAPTVSVIGPTCGSTGTVWGVSRIFVHDAIASLLAAPSAVSLEIVAVIDEGTPDVVERGLRQIAGDALRAVHYNRPFNFSEKINQGVAASQGDYVLLLNDDTELIESGSVDEMVGLAQDPTIGMVGAKLLFADGRLQHAGHTYHGVITHALLGWSGDHPGPHGYLLVERECAGVTAAAALLRRDVFDEVGGLDEGLPGNYNDVDLSLKIRERGYRVVWTPHASWYHFEQQSFDHPIDQAEVDRIVDRWGDAAASDPYCNPNLALNRNDWLELPLRSGAPTG